MWRGSAIAFWIAPLVISWKVTRLTSGMLSVSSMPSALQQVPGDRLSLAVGVGGENQLSLCRTSFLSREICFWLSGRMW